jgi:accessory gene regulator protein AgrB
VRRRIVNTATVVFWVSVPLLGMVLILPWLQIDWLQNALAVPTTASSAALLVLTYAPGYVSSVSLSLDAERVVYVLVFVYAAGTLAF